LWPFNGLGSNLEVSAKGVGDLNASTPMLQSAINAGLGGNYRLRGGMATRNGQVVAYYQALSGDKVKLVIIGQPKDRVQQVKIMDQNVVTVWGSKLGTPFSNMYSKAFGACKLATDEDAGKVAC
ncbi:MAG: DUF1131 domain-containing protein, partial [Serratia symbiotica]|nr:DUF1131 domain-containing protein [Serratia symbiotica]